MYRQRNVAAVVVAAGASTRMGFDKMFQQIHGVEILRLAVARLDEHPFIDEIVVVGGANLGRIEKLFAGKPTKKPLKTVLGGETRLDSVVCGVNACGTASIVAVHDGARPFVTAEIISNVIEAAAEYGAAAPAVPVKDTIKKVLPTAKGDLVESSLPRGLLRSVQTPQAFERDSFLKAVSIIPPDKHIAFTDDCMVIEHSGAPVYLVAGDERNFKITTPEDIKIAIHHLQPQASAAQAASPAQKAAAMRIGHGYDVHKLVPGRKLILGGVDIPHTYGLLGHSDADVLAHVVSDALLGALALGDIGKHFPDTDPNFAGADSIQLLKQVGQMVYQQGYTIANIDATILCQAPKLAPYIVPMRESLAAALHVPAGLVSVKATTEEGLGFTGSRQGIAAHCVVLLAPA